MGKRTRRKRTGSKSSTAAVNNNKSNSNNKDVPTGPALQQRIRHADATTRHAALTAALHTQFSSFTKNKPVSSQLLQCVRDAVMDVDPECAVAALQCLSNYVQFCESADDALTAGWMVLLAGRLQECLTNVTTSVSTSNSNNATATKWLLLAEQCLQCTVSLLEHNLLATARLIPGGPSQTSPTLRNESLAIWLQWAQYCLTTTTAASKVAAASTTTSAKSTDGSSDMVVVVAATKKDEQQAAVAMETTASLLQHIHLLSMRSLHSAWDDNAELVLGWMREQPDAAKECFGGVMLSTAALSDDCNSNSSNNNSVVRQTVLHCSGAWLAVHSLLELHREQMSSDTVEWAQPMLQAALPRMVGVLSSNLQQFDAAAVQDLLQRVVTAYAAFQEQEADSNLEREVVTAVDQKKEPARQIARRMKDSKQQDETQASSAAAAMVEDDNDDDDDEGGDGGEDTPKRGTLPADRPDRVAEWQDVEQDWQELVRPFQLALEIAANLTSGGAGAEQDAMMDDEQEDEIMADSALDDHVATALVQAKLPDQIIVLLGQVSSRTWTTTSQEGLSLPDEVLESLADLQNKAGTCLGHCLAALQDWNCPASMWSDLQAAMVHAVKEGRSGISSAMVVALQSRDGVRTQLQALDLENVLELITDESPLVVRDAVCMVGILCSQERHPAAVNEKACRALLQALTVDKQSTIVVAEVLGVLMDIYGDDECHPGVFDSLDVIGHFVRTVPVLKQRISIDTEADPEDIEQWKETALNASGFIQYKKDQL